ncbi:BTAD domain-containing putative transcriptional regulator [Streptomyces griseorubiginosus]|uniref:BTAD domain-containing putative transcriptional regulator n=1 Tax=Streptomyces griseorubiginosus TaxID=67304 RepID=UPI0033AFB2BD
MRVVEFGVLGAVAAWDETGQPIALKGPRHRAVLARLLVARRRVVPVSRLVADLWGERPPGDAVGTVRTFVAALRRALEPERPRRAPARLLVTEGPGYALRAEPDHVDAWRFEPAVASAVDLPPARAVPRLTEALELWRGPAYADFAEEPWARAERSRLAELRLTAVERRAEAQLALGAAADAVADLDAHVAEHPWREDAWRLLALALYRSGRQADALSLLRHARHLLSEHLGVEPGPRLRRTEETLARPGGQAPSRPSERDSSHAGGPDVSRLSGWNSSHPGGPDISHLGGRDTSHPGGWDSASLGGQHASHPGGQAPSRPSERDSSHFGGPDISHLGGQDASHPGGQAASRPSERDSSHAGGPDVSRLSGQDTSHPGGQDASHPGGQAPLRPGERDSSHAGGPDVSRLSGQDTSHPGGQHASHPGGQAPLRPGERDSSHPRGPDVSRPSRRDTSHPSSRDTSHPSKHNGDNDTRPPTAPAVPRRPDHGPLHRTEQDILRHADHLDPASSDTAAEVWAQASAAYESMIPLRVGTRLESTAGLMRVLAVTGGGGLEAARRHRAAAVAAAEQLGDPELTARVIGVYDVPAVWTRSDDPAQAERLVAAAERTLLLLPPTAHEASRARLLATVALESRGALPSRVRALQAARQAVASARRLGDAGLLVFALNGLFMQTFEQSGLAARRDEIGAEITAVAAQHGLFTYEVLGHLIRLQAHCATADFTAAERHAHAADALAEHHELPLVAVFTTWYHALRTATTEPAQLGESAYRNAAKSLEGAGMPGLERGLLPLALLCLRLHHGLPLTPDTRADWGPYEPWVRPLLLLAEGQERDAVRLLTAVPEPPGDLLHEALWSLLARAAVQVGDRPLMRRAQRALAPADGELAGAASGLLTAGPVSGHLDALTAALARHTS